jgi:alpha-beta hydrolase superfamily lysophospholipase
LSTFSLPAGAGLPLFVHRWLPADAPRRVVQIVHGMVEHGGRYAQLAEALNAAGHAVYAHDQRGHGRTAPAPADLGYPGNAAGWRTLIEDVDLVQARIAKDFPGVPIVLLGHSMGAFVAQQFAGERGASLRGLILTGTYQESRGLARAGSLLARLERWRLGRRGQSRLIQALTFDAYNKRFGPWRTAFDWLSRDPGEVDRYIADPLCGCPPSVQIWVEVLDALANGLPLPPPDLPICLMTGGHDAMCGPDSHANKLAASFRASGCRLTHLVYPGARHELFHETNREEVTRDLVEWLDSVVSGRFSTP